MKFLKICFLLFYITIANSYAEMINVLGTIHPPINNNLSVSYSGGLIQTTGNQKSWTDLCQSPKICHGSALEVYFGGAIFDVTFNGTLGTQTTGQCYVIPYWLINATDFYYNYYSSLYDSLSAIETAGSNRKIFIDTSNMKTFQTSCSLIKSGTFKIMMAPGTGWINVSTYSNLYSDYFFYAWSKDWYATEIPFAMGLFICSSIPANSGYVNDLCVQSPYIIYPLGKGSDLPAAEPTICNLSGDGVIDFGNLQASEINGLSKEVDLNLQCNKSTAVSLDLLSNSLSMNGATAKLTMNDKESLKVSLNENQAVNIKLKALLSVNGTPTLGEHSASTVLLYSPE